MSIIFLLFHKLHLEMKNKSCILVVDDSKPIRDSFRDYFKMKEFQVVTANDGFNAIKQFTKYAPDVILMDYMMPGINGHETLQKIKKLDPCAKFIIITAHDSPIPLSKKERKNIPIILKPSTFSQINSVVEDVMDIKCEEGRKNTRMVSILIDDDLYEKLKNKQSDIMKRKKNSVSFANIINNTIKEYFDDKENDV